MGCERNWKILWFRGPLLLTDSRERVRLRLKMDSEQLDNTALFFAHRLMGAVVGMACSWY